MTEKEFKRFNYSCGGNNYILRGNARWIAFQSSIVGMLRRRFDEQFNLVVYSTSGGNVVNYICVPYADIKHLFTDELLTIKADGTECWNCVIRDEKLMVHANSGYAVNIDKYLNVGFG